MTELIDRRFYEAMVTRCEIAEAKLAELEKQLAGGEKYIAKFQDACIETLLNLERRMSKQEVMDSLCKFRIGQVVSFVAHRAWSSPTKDNVLSSDTTKAQIIERHAVQCHGGVQIYYLIRSHFNELYRGTTHALDFQRVAEIELTDASPE